MPRWAFIYPWLEGFEALALFLLAVLVPAGLLIGTPRYARAAGTSPSSMSRRRGDGNVFTPDPLAFANFCFALASACSSASWWRASCR